MHDVALSTAPVAVILIGILFGIFYNQRVIGKVETRIDKLEVRMEASFALIRQTLDVIQSDLKILYRILGQHDEAIATLKKRTEL